MNTKRNRKLIWSIVVAMIMSNSLLAQLNISGILFNQMLVTPASMNRLIVMVGEGIHSIEIEAELRDAETNEVILRTVSNPISVIKGVNTISPTSQGFYKKLEKGGSNLTDLILLQKRLPSGAYEYCVRVYSYDGEYFEDEYCKDYFEVVNEYLRLVSPSNGDTISTKLPILNWTTSAVQEMQLGRKDYRLILAPMEKDDSSPEIALNVNPSIFVEVNCKSFSIPYPSSAEQLLPLHSYAWRVEVIMDGEVVEESQSWKFVIEGREKKESLKYASLKRDLGGASYKVIDDKIFFAFEEKYFGQKDFPKCQIRNDNGKLIKDPLQHDPETLAQSEETDNVTVPGTVQGSNKFLLDISHYNLQAGIYSLEVWNFKGEMTKLKFEIE